jgi:hypothetical protein
VIGPLRQLGPKIDTFATIPAPALGQLHITVLALVPPPCCHGGRRPGTPRKLPRQEA